MARWRRDTAKERTWRRHVARWQRSGLSIRDYCEVEGLVEATRGAGGPTNPQGVRQLGMAGMRRLG